jgi:hypothetical protein
VRPCRHAPHAFNSLQDAARLGAPLRKIEPIDAGLQLLQDEVTILETYRVQQRRTRTM